MRVLDRYLIVGYLKALVFCLAFFYILYVLIDSFNHLDEFLRNNVTPQIIFSYYASFLPSLAVQLLPVAALVSLLYVLSTLNRHNEIIAIHAGGIGSAHLLLPYLFAGILLSLGSLLANETVVPVSNVTSAAIKEGLIEKGRKNLGERAIQNVALYSEGNLMVFAREYEIMTQTLHDVVLIEGGLDEAVKSKTMARKGEYRDGHWVLTDVVLYKLNRRGDLVGEPARRPSLDIPLSAKPEDFIKEASQTDYMNSKELRKYIAGLEGSSDKLVRRLTVDLHAKTAMSFVCLVLILIGAPLAIHMGPRGVMKGVGTAFFILLAYYVSQSVCLALGKGGWLPPAPAAWFCNVAFAGAGAVLMKRHG